MRTAARKVQTEQITSGEGSRSQRDYPQASYRNISHAKRYYQTIPCTESPMRNLSRQVNARPAERTVLLRDILDAAWLPKMVFQEERV